MSIYKYQADYRVQLLEFCFFDQNNFPEFTCNYTYPWTNCSEEVTTSQIVLSAKALTYNAFTLGTLLLLLIICMGSYIHIHIDNVLP